MAAAEQQPGLTPNDALALRFVRRTLAGEIVRLSTASFSDEYADVEAAATVTLPWKDKPVAYRDLQEPDRAGGDPDRRRQIFAAMNAVRVQKLNPILQRKEQAAQKAAARPASPITSRSRGLAQRQARSAAGGGRRLREGDRRGPSAPRSIGIAREELDTPRREAAGRDLSRLWKAPHLSRFFDRELELRALQVFLGGIGLDLRTAQAPTCGWTTACTRKSSRALSSSRSMRRRTCACR